MARGDVVNDVQSLTNGSNLDFQPAAGVELIVQEFSVTAIAGVTLIHYNGTLTPNVTTGDKADALGGLVRLLINNTNYLRINNGSGSTRNVAFGAITSK